MAATCWFNQYLAVRLGSVFFSQLQWHFKMCSFLDGWHSCFYRNLYLWINIYSCHWFNHYFDVLPTDLSVERSGLNYYSCEVMCLLFHLFYSDNASVSVVYCAKIAWWIVHLQEYLTSMYLHYSFIHLLLVYWGILACYHSSSVYFIISEFFIWFIIFG